MKENKNTVPELGMDRATDILNAVFKECGRKPNSVPMEALSAYTIYRKERFGLQRGILVSLLVLFFLLPFLFIDSDFSVRVEAAGERRLPVYVIEVQSLLPVHRVTANVEGQSLPVYEADARTFTVEPTRNGKMTVEVALMNRQNTAMKVEVTDVDHKCPVLTGSEVTGSEVHLYVEDAGTGVHLNRAYGILVPEGPASAGASDGEEDDPAVLTGIGADPEKKIEPVRTDPENGLIVFAYPSRTMDVYIPDHIGNILHLALRVGENR